MHDPERKALARAATALLAVSALRWGLHAASPSARDVTGGADLLEEHIAETSRAASEEARRRRPLGEGERIDPNDAPEAELDRLPGVGPGTASAIVAARDSGLVFARPEDLLAVRGIGPATLARMQPRLDLRERRADPGRRTGSRRGRDPPAPAAHPLDLNRADEEALQTLPGIGPALARRIVDERRRRPFTSLDDLGRVRGIGPATVARLNGMAVAGSGR